MHDVYKKHVGMLLLKLQQQCMLPSSTLQIIFDSVKDLIALVVDKILENMRNVCTKNNVVPKLSDELAYLLDTVQYYKEKFSYVKPNVRGSI